jgi:hypothetical protein
VEAKGVSMSIRKILLSEQIEDGYYIKEFDDYCRLYEASLASVWRHASKGLIMMSGCVSRVSKKENEQRHNKLKAELRDHGLGYFELDGVYKYEDGHTESELSVFVPYNKEKYKSFDEFMGVGIKLGKEFGQESVLIKYPDDTGNGKAVLAFSSGDVVEIGTKVGYDKIADAYSKLRKGRHKGRTFVIESYVLTGVRVPMNHINAMQLMAEGILF